ncbi:MAG: hypothetical protein KF878_23725, partial [Planctomycetes bacterium]|nr:hypothetical protein [Planctomycetota bacterium]
MTAPEEDGAQPAGDVVADAGARTSNAEDQGGESALPTHAEDTVTQEPPPEAAPAPEVDRGAVTPERAEPGQAVAPAPSDERLPAPEGDRGAVTPERAEPGRAVAPAPSDERLAAPEGDRGAVTPERAEPGRAVAPAPSDERLAAPEVDRGAVPPERAEPGQAVAPAPSDERLAAPAVAPGHPAQAGRAQARAGARTRGIERHYRVRPSLRARAQRLLVASPGYAVAGFVHLLAIVVLSFFTVAAALDERRPPVEVRLVASTEEVVSAPERPTTRLDVAPPDLDAALRPEVHAGDPFHEALGPDVGHLAGAAKAFGVGASGGAGRGGKKDERGGASAASDGALHLGLDWLVRHRAESGAWGDLPARHDSTGALPRDGEVAHTGLAVLCFLFAGHGPEREGPYREVVRTAIAWLAARVGRDGVFGRDYQGYHQAIGTLALAEALARERTPELQGALRRAVGCLEDAQHHDGGWRYRPGDRGDTSVTTWVALALKSAGHAGVTINRRTWDLLRRFLDSVSRPDGSTAYMSSGYGTVAMGASGLFLRLMLGEAPTTPRNRAAVRLLSRYGETVPHGAIDHYCVYYVALAMFQVGGEPWHRLNPVLRDTLVARQRTGGCERGAWTEWQTPMLSTTFAILTLETYYRYLTTHDGPGGADETPGRAALGEATQLLEQAARHGDRGLSLAAEAAFEAALAAVVEESDDPELVAEVRARLVQCAALLGDGERALARA